MDVFPQNQTFPQPPTPGQGLALVPSVNVADQSLVKANVLDVIVTESGSFATNANSADVQSFVQLGAAVRIDADLPTERFQLFLKAPVDLTTFGLDLTDMIVGFPAEGPPTAPENFPHRPILAYSMTWILVSKFDQFGNALTTPAANKSITIAILRDGSQAVNDVGISEVDVFIAPAPPVAQTVPAPGLPFLGNLQASDGVVVPFVGSGVQLPPLLGTFEVENQVPIGSGLPINVFVP